ncbi:MAG: TatD family hydrolase [Spirochaetaceae bacterium]|jgi:TatD DNase family protein|nr:TatD family hydrolase [Spirochaetaceae bacterium]
MKNSLPDTGFLNKESDFLRGLIDTHAHLSMLSTNNTEHAMPEESKLKDFAFILDIGTEPEDLLKRIKVLGKLPNTRFAAGIWPTQEAIAARFEKISLLQSQIQNAPGGSVAAIGECGYDRRENPSSPPEETELLELQLNLAQQYQLPIIIHSREAPQETIQTLRRFPGTQGIIHCFSYGPQEAKEFLDLGYYISFAGNLTFKNALNLREAIAVIPSDRLLLETDCPFLAPVPYRGHECLPDMIIETYKAAALARNTEPENIKKIVRHNAQQLFKLEIQDGGAQ